MTREATRASTTLISGALALMALFITPRLGADDRVFRMAISAELMREVNENDARASLRTWMLTLSEHANVELDSNVDVLPNAEALIQAFGSKQVDSATVTTAEFLALDRTHGTTNLLAERGDDAGDVYLLLVHERSGITNITELKGRDLLLSDSMRMSLGLPWLDVLLMRHGMPVSEDFFRSIVRKKKLANIVLPVFFRSAAVCLVPKRGFDAMVELNPQVGKRLRVLAQSQKYVGGLVCFRRDYVGAHLQKVTDGILGFQKTTRGQQVLTIFQAEPVGWLSRESLTSAIQLLEEYHRLKSTVSLSNITANTSPDVVAPP